MKRTLQTLLVLATATTVCSPVLAAGAKEERFVLSSAAEPIRATNNTAVVTSVMPTDKKKDDVFAIGLEALKWVGAIVVLARGGPNNGHVGIVRGTDGAGNIIVISGNHGNKVWEASYPKSRVLGYVIPPESN